MRRAGTEIETISPSGSATVVFTSGIDSTYKAYALVLVDVVPATDSVWPWLRVSTDGGSTFKSGASDYWWGAFDFSSAGSGATGSGADSKIVLIHSADTVGSDTGEGMCGMIMFFNPAGTSQYQRFQWQMAFNRADERMVGSVGGAHYRTVAAINAIRFMFSSGNIESGILKLLGLQ